MRIDATLVREVRSPHIWMDCCPQRQQRIDKYSVGGYSQCQEVKDDVAEYSHERLTPELSCGAQWRRVVVDVTTKVGATKRHQLERLVRL